MKNKLEFELTGIKLGTERGIITIDLYAKEKLAGAFWMQLDTATALHAELGRLLGEREIKENHGR